MSREVAGSYIEVVAQCNTASTVIDCTGVAEYAPQIIKLWNHHPHRDVPTNGDAVTMREASGLLR